MKSLQLYTTDAGILSELSSGKVRWWPFSETRVSIFSGSGAKISSMQVSNNNEWAAFARSNRSLWVLKLRGGSGNEISIPIEKLPSNGSLNAIHLQKKKNYHILYVGDSQGILASWNIENEKISEPQLLFGTIGSHNVTELGPITAITSFGDEIFVAVQDGTKIVRVDAQGRVLDDSFPLCPTPPIKNLIVADHIQCLVTSSTQNRHIALYKLQDPTKFQYLSCNSAAKILDVSPHYLENTYQPILALTEIGEIYIWKVSSNVSKKPLSAQTRIKLDPSSLPGHSILAAKFSPSNANTILVVYGIHTKPSFEEMKYINENGNFVSNLNLKSSEKSLMMNRNPTTTMQNKEFQNRSDNVPLITHSDIPLDCAVPFDSGVSNNKKSSIKKSQDSDDLECDSSDVPFEKLVSKKKDQDKLNEQNNMEYRVNSAAAALSAALSSNNREELRSILENQDEEFMKATLRKLPISQVLPLLSYLLFLFNSKPSLELALWTRKLLIIHQSYLASAPEILNKLSGLYHNIDSRLTNLPQLLKLNGRFDLLLSRIKDQKNEISKNRPLQSYVEPDEEQDESNEDDNDNDDDIDYSCDNSYDHESGKNDYNETENKDTDEEGDEEMMDEDKDI